MTRPVQPCTFHHILSHAPRSADLGPTIASSAAADPLLDDVVTVEQLASIDFEPLPPGVDPLPSKEDWQETHRTLFYNLQLAVGTMRKTKAELVASVPQLTTDDGDLIKRMVESLNDTASMLKCFEEIITKAELRWLCAAAVYATSQDEQP